MVIEPAKPNPPEAHQMTITPARSIRAIGAALVAALAIALLAASFAPGAQASKNTGRFKQSVEAVKLEKLSRAQLCDSLQGSYQDLTVLAEGQFEQGDLAGSTQSDDAAAEAKRQAGHQGCAWAL